MPEYKFLNKETNEEWTEFMSISERTQFLADNPHVEQLVHGAPMVAYRTGQTRTKPDDGFRDLLRAKKKAAGRRSTINTF